METLMVGERTPNRNYFGVKFCGFRNEAIYGGLQRDFELCR